jgi:hypothetical protein
MKVGDKVRLNLYNKDQVGSVLKVHKKLGWEGYVNVLLENKSKIDIPGSFLEVIHQK